MINDSSAVKHLTERLFSIPEMTPREFVAMYGMDAALNLTGISPETFSKYISKPTSKRYVRPSDFLKRQLGLFHYMISEGGSISNVITT